MKPQVERSVYVLGVGCIAASGYGPEQILAAVEYGEEFSLLSGGESTRAYPKSPVEISNFDPAEYLTMRGLRPLSRASRLCCVAAAAALDCSTRPSANQDHHAVIVGTQWGSIEPLVEFNWSAATNGVRLVDPGQFPNVVVNVHAGYLGILFGLGGPNVTVCGQSASLEAVGLGLDMLQLGQADRVLAGGVEALGLTILDGLQRQHESSDNAPPGEGAAFLLLSNQIRIEKPPLARVANFATITTHGASNRLLAREAVIQRVLELSNTDSVVPQMIWCAGEPLDQTLIQKYKGTRIQWLQNTTGNCRAANGALATVLAVHQILQGLSSVLVTDFPSSGSQNALLLCKP